MKAIVSTAYCGNIEYFSVLKNAEEVLLETHEHFQKQSYRNRAIIHGANGPLNLIIPLNRKGERVQILETTINNEQNWQLLHWRSLEAAYRSSPYFEYYEHEFALFYKNQFENLLEYNSAIQDKIIQLLGINVNLKETSSYQKSYEGYDDFRNTIHPKIDSVKEFPAQKYIQVFEARNGFIPNLSVLDLLFNEGPNSINFL